MPVGRDRDVDLVGAEYPVTVVGASERTAFHPTRLHVTRLARGGQLIDDGRDDCGPVDSDDVDLRADRRLEQIRARGGEVGRAFRGVDLDGREARVSSSPSSSNPPWALANEHTDSTTDFGSPPPAARTSRS